MRLMYMEQLDSKANQMPVELKKQVIHDLDIKKLANYISLDGIYTISADELMDMMSYDPETIKYRQQLSKVLFNNQNLYNEFFRLYQKLQGLREIASNTSRAIDRSVSNHVRAVKWIDLFGTLISDLVDIFNKYPEAGGVESLGRLKNKVFEISQSDEYKVMVKNINQMKTDGHKLDSIVMGVNLNEYLEPVGVNCLQVDDFYYYPQKMVEIRKNGKKHHGIGKFKYHPAGRKKQGDIRYDEMRAPAVLADTTKFQRFVSCEINIEYVKSLDSFLKSLNFNNNNIIKKYVLEKIKSILGLADDLGFFLGGIQMAKKLSNMKMPVSLPDTSEEENYLTINDIYNCYLPFVINNPSDEIVLNDFNLNKEYSYSILNGPNKGGKTTFIQGLCLTVILFQLGLYCPCSKAKINPFDMILTHYLNEEKESRTGRLSAEADEIKKIFSHATGKSLVIFNEPFVSTSPAEGRYLMLSALAGVRELGFRGIFVTHYHKLNEQVEKDNDDAYKKISFLNMGINADGSSGGLRTYELIKGRGEVKSFAMDILKEYAPDLLD